MKKVIGLLMMSAMSIVAFAHGEGSLSIGSKWPLVTEKITDVTGRSTTLQDESKTNGLLVMFSCNTCPYVIRNQERTNNICSYALQNGFGVVILNSNAAQRDQADSFEAMQGYAKEQGYNWTYAIDENAKIADAFGASRTPEVFLFNKDGKLLYKGAIDDNPSDPTAVKKTFLKDALESVAEGKEIAVSESKSVGCTIKRVAKN